MPDDAFRLGIVPGVTPAKWVRTWQERHRRPLELHQLGVTTAAAALQQGEVDMAVLRPPVDPGTTSTIPLYTEVAVVVAAKDHALAALDRHEEVRADDLKDEPFLLPEDDVYLGRDHIPGPVLSHRPAATADAVPLAAAGTGLLIVPLSVARLHHRRDLIHRPLAAGPPAQVLLAWLNEHTSEDIQDFIGIVRGRTINSTRGRPQHSGQKPDPSEGPAARHQDDENRQSHGRSQGDDAKQQRKPSKARFASTPKSTSGRTPIKNHRPRGARPHRRGRRR